MTLALDPLGDTSGQAQVVAPLPKHGTGKLAVARAEGDITRASFEYMREVCSSGCI